MTVRGNNLVGTGDPSAPSKSVANIVMWTSGLSVSSGTILNNSGRLYQVNNSGITGSEHSSVSIATGNLTNNTNYISYLIYTNESGTTGTTATRLTIAQTASVNNPNIYCIYLIDWPSRSKTLRIKGYYNNNYYEIYNLFTQINFSTNQPVFIENFSLYSSKGDGDSGLYVLLLNNKIGYFQFSNTTYLNYANYPGPTFTSGTGTDGTLSLTYLSSV